MLDKQVIDEFWSTWKYTRQMTTVFIEGVPDDKWEFSHHPKFGPLCQQFRHMVGVYGCYIDAIRSRKIDLKKKKAFFSGEMTRERILASLVAMDVELRDVLDDLVRNGLEGFEVDLFGMKMGFTEYSHVMIQHECSHFGIWSNYAAFGDFPTPQMWQDEWEL